MAANVRDVVVYDQVMRSNLQPEEKSIIRKWAEQMIGPLTDTRIRDMPGGALSAARQGAEGMLAAGVLAYIHVNNETGLDIKGVPVDGLAGAFLLGASAFMGHSELSSDARNFGNDALTICFFRKASDFFAERRKVQGKALHAHLTPGNPRPSHDAKSDPIVSFSESL